MTMDVYSENDPLDVPGYALLWAKSDKNSQPDTHLLIYHLVDVGECTLAFWNLTLSEQRKRHVARILDLDMQQTGRQVALWAALHDLGKAAPGFQRKYYPALAKLQAARFHFPPQTPNPVPHGVLTAWSLMDFFVSEDGMSRRDAIKIAVALGGHHGAWPTNDRFSPLNLRSGDKGNETWHRTRREIFQTLKDGYEGINGARLFGDQRDLNVFLTLFSGLVSVADWIGSIPEIFRFKNNFIPFDSYKEQAASTAREALEKLGWIGWKASGQQATFTTMFPSIKSPNEIQEHTIQTAKDSQLPTLVILEAPTGTGKTEAALFLADRWLQSVKGQGIYIAMPTQATSNQMYERFVDFLETRYPHQSINAHLAHSAALLALNDQSKLIGIAQDDSQNDPGVKAESWFLPRKRTLLAPFGVGTVDQAFLSVLKTNHFFVRMYGLGHKVIIFDEVHAYDTYMSTLFERLLAWLKSIGSSVIILSATLPLLTRQSLLGAWLGEKINLTETGYYPALTTVHEGRVEIKPLPRLSSRKIALSWVNPQPVSLATLLEEKLSAGGCAAVVCNRVQRAQEVYAELRDRKVCAPENLILFHARYPFHWRDEIEKKVLALFSKKRPAGTGPNPNRPQKAIVVATQVIEQSLDLDFDFLVSDLAPVDLIIQRAGRLQRHPQNDSHRPPGLRDAELALAQPKFNNGIPDFGLDCWVYDLAVLLRSWWCLQGKNNLLLPDETMELIESVYGQLNPRAEMPPELRAAIETAMNQMRQQHEKEIFEAKKRLIAAPMDEGLLSDANEGLEEEHPGIHQAFRALTRMASPGVSIVCLHQCAQGISLDPDGQARLINLDKRPDTQLVRELLRRTVNVQNRELVDYFSTNGGSPDTWREIAAIRHHYPVIFDLNGEFHPAGAGFRLKLDRELGLLVSKEAR